MALVDDIEFYGRAVAAQELDQASAITALVEASNGGLTQAGAADIITNWQTARGRVRAELDRAAAGLDEIWGLPR